MEYLYEKLEAYGKSDYYGFHMPGHKRNSDVTQANLPYGIDITEIEGFDNLHHAEEIIREAEVRAASMYHAEETHYLINGSTAGILSAVMGCTKKGGKILMARNCHKSVYHAVFLNELRPVYIYPEFDETMELNMAVSPEKIERLLEEHKEVQAVVLTSPTYDGVLSDIERISEIVHQKKIPLIVDEAHGAHFGFHPYFPENANTKGADVVIHSLHKTLPALTQTALIHLNGTRIDRRKIRNYLHIFQTSSPSYVLMASMDECLRMVAEQGDVLFETYVKNLESKRGELKKLKHIRLMETEEFDRSKLVLSVKDTILKKENRVFTGKMLYPSNGACWRYQQDQMLEIMRGWCGYELRDLNDAHERAVVCGVPESDVRQGVQAIVLSESLEISAQKAQAVYSGVWHRHFPQILCKRSTDTSTT